MEYGLVAFDVGARKHAFAASFAGDGAAIAHDPHAKAFRNRLVARSKAKMQALAAVMRKLLTAAWALIRRPATYDGAKLFATQEG